MSNTQAKKPDPRAGLVWWPKGFCSGWNQKTQSCNRGNQCGCKRKEKS